MPHFIVTLDLKTLIALFVVALLLLGFFGAFLVAVLHDAITWLWAKIRR